MFQQGLMYLLRWPLEASTDQSSSGGVCHLLSLDLTENARLQECDHVSFINRFIFHLSCYQFPTYCS